MPDPYVVRFVPEEWKSDAFGWGFYEREEVEQSTYDKEPKKVVKEVQAPVEAPVVQAPAEIAACKSYDLKCVHFLAKFD
jgi:hypothetical protein